jgi:hypothetical protein
MAKAAFGGGRLSNWSARLVLWTRRRYGGGGGAASLDPLGPIDTTFRGSVKSGTTATERGVLTSRYTGCRALLDSRELAGSTSSS